MSRNQKTAEQRLREVASELTDAYIFQCREYFSSYPEDAATDSTSPIEQLMAMALVFAISTEGWHGGPRLEKHFVYGQPPTTFEDLRAIKPQRAGIQIHPEVGVGKYRADFIVRYAHWHGGVAWGAIECDGHDHHDLTKDQAQRDRARDRYFQNVGLIVLRYPGSEIWRSPLKCAADALSILEKRAAANDSTRWQMGE